MKKLLSILCLVLLVSCSNEVPDDQLVERQGITYEVNSTTPFTGSSVNYYDNGQLKQKENYKDGKQDGLLEKYYSNGQLWSRQNFKNGKQDGLLEDYYRKGQLFKRGKYNDDTKEGLWEKFYDNGQVEFERTYIEGKIIESKYYQESGERIKEITIADSKWMLKMNGFAKGEYSMTFEPDGNLKYSRVHYILGTRKVDSGTGTWEIEGPDFTISPFSGYTILEGTFVNDPDYVEGTYENKKGNGGTWYGKRQ
jgi:hypothetical protein